MTALLEAPPLAGFDELPAVLEADAPPEARGLRRHEVRMLASSRDPLRLEHTSFTDLPRVLRAGDLLVVNTSGTLPAAVDAVTADGQRVLVHLSTELDRESPVWVVEVRVSPSRRAPTGLVAAGDVLRLPGGAVAELVTPYPLGTAGPTPRLWVAVLHLDSDAPDVRSYLQRFGRPIRYGHVRESWPLTAYQTVFATVPGSAEMPSAARPFTPELVTALVAAGVAIAPLVLHCGVSSLELHEPPYPERYTVPSDTARRVNATHEWGGRVVAVGTTVVRALETVVDDRGLVHPGEGWTETVVTPERGVRAVDGIISGWHEPRASHLALIEAVAGRPLLQAAYAEALEQGYLWHEFGDIHLVLP